MKNFTRLLDLASSRLGGRVLRANDEFFACKENLLKPESPIYIEGKYTGAGKWMDGWETRRRRTPGYDWCIVRLGLPGVIRGVVVDTTHFKGNHPPHCSLEACAAESDAAALADSADWSEILPKSRLKADSVNPFAIANRHRYTHLRLNIYPDGGVARLRIHGEPVLDWRTVSADECIDLASAMRGGRVVACSDEFFGAPQNLLMPGRGANMGDGWETRRRRGPGHDWAIIELAIAGTIQSVEVDTAHFKGNFPESFSLESCALTPAKSLHNARWEPLLPRMPLQADAQHQFQVSGPAAATHVRFNIYPDGGISRLRIFGIPAGAARTAATLQLFNLLPDSAVRAGLISCCGSSRWAEAMLRQRPFSDAAKLKSAADRIWKSLRLDDRLEAFRHHPEIGRRKAAAAQSQQAQLWSLEEQGEVAGSSSTVLDELEQANREYARRFGFIFLVYASGKTAEEMLANLRGRMNNQRGKELKIAAEEQRRIMQHRLGKWLGL
jgi:allantoicase